MSDFNREDLSAFIDGELEDGSSDRVIDRLLKEETDRDTWMRYHLIGESMRRSLPSHLDRRLSASIAARLRDEPTVLSPARKPLPAYIKPLAGLAVAASVATIAVIGVQQQRQENAAGVQEPRVATVQPDIPAERAFHPTARPASIETSRPAMPAVSAAAQQPVQSRMNPRLNNYLINYNEYHANAGMQGMLPYVRIVAHDRNE